MSTALIAWRLFSWRSPDNEGTYEFKYYPEKLLTIDASTSDELTLIKFGNVGRHHWFSFIYHFHPILEI